jgi:ribosomal protein S18 acetylase RimI-like enzyme
MDLPIRPAVPDDAERLAKLKLETFRETFVDGFAIPYPPADLAVFETASYGLPAVAGELADLRRRNWVVERDGEMLGYAQVGPCKLPHPEAAPDHGELYQLYVRGEAQGLGLGKRLLATALDYLAEARPGPVWLGVWSGNLKAQAVYRKIGFAKVGDYKFPVGSWHDEEYIFRLAATHDGSPAGR